MFADAVFEVASETNVATTVAAIKGKQIQVYGTDLTKPIRTLTNWVDVKGRVVFNVIGQQGDFLDVKVPAKPNGAHGFVKASDVDTFQHSCRISADAHCGNA